MKLKSAKLKPILALLTAGLLMAHNAGAENYRWDSVAIGGGGFVTGIVTSKTERGIIYARTDVGGAYRWDAPRARWIAMQDWVSEGQIGLLGVESIAVDPNNAANVYLLAGTSYYNNGKTAILRSTDYGATFSVTDVSGQFKAHGNGQGRATGEKLQVDPGSPNVLYLGARSEGLFKSTDFGATWARVTTLDTGPTSENGISFVMLDPTSVENGVATRIFVGVSRLGSNGPNLYFSYDGGEGFIEVEGGPADLVPQRAVMSPEGKVYITYADGVGPGWSNAGQLTKGAIWEYDAAGGNWTNITPLNRSHPFSGISIDPNDPNHLAASTMNTWWFQQNGAWGDRIFTSRDAGRTWVDVVERGFAMDNQGANWINNKAIHWTSSIEFDPFDSKSVLVTSGNGLFRTSNIDAPTTTWDFNVAGLEETVPLNAVSIANGPLVSVIGDYDGFIHHDVTQFGPQHAPQMGTTSGLAVASGASNVMVRVGGSMYFTTNSGASWAKTASLNGQSGQVALSADGNVLLHSPDNSATSYRSTNFGASWTAVAGLTDKWSRPVADAVNSTKFYAYDQAAGRLLASTDGGETFSPKAVLQVGGSNQIRVAPGREGDIWACAGGLTHSIDSGTSFSKIDTVNSCSAVGLGKEAPGAAYPTVYIWGTVGKVRGLLRSTDQGATWVRVNDDAHQFGGLGNGQFVVGDMNTYGTVYMSTTGRGIAYGKADALGDVIVTPAVPEVVNPNANKCEYVKTADWGSGHNAAIRITNNGPATLNGWKVEWTYTDGSVVWGFWNAAVAGTSPNYSATPSESWNTSIAPGATVEFGMTVGGSVIPALGGDTCK